ncbi:MAG: hypothetical protein SFU86_17835 [Pirellulaceae bacterium]|nr:hypothetical protein [Pirellulaceae bacterium]
MRKISVVLLVVALLLIGLGFYRGWIALSNPGTGDGSHKVNVNLTLDRDKVQDDAQAVQEKASELIGQEPQPPEHP